MMPNMMVRTRSCQVCGSPGFVRMPADEYEAWKGGAMVQQAAPSLTVEEREQLLSGTHARCWEELAGGE